MVLIVNYTMIIFLLHYWYSYDGSFFQGPPTVPVSVSLKGPPGSTAIRGTCFPSRGHNSSKERPVLVEAVSGGKSGFMMFKKSRGATCGRE